MSEHPNVATVNSMTTAIFNQDKDALAKIFTDNMRFHLRGPWDRAGDYDGVGGFLDVLGSMFEETGGDIVLDQLFCIGTDGWAAEWEHATLGRNGKKLESNNSFVYRFVDGRIAEMWMFLGMTPEAFAAWTE